MRSNKFNMQGASQASASRALQQFQPTIGEKDCLVGCVPRTRTVEVPVMGACTLHVPHLKLLC